LWHGTNEKKCDYICRSGFAYFGKQDLEGKFLSADNTDEGFFGSGIYFTNSARYAADCYAEGHLLLAWVSMREPFPVVGDPLQSDMKGLKGKYKYKNYDTRYIPVDSKSPTDPYCANYYPPKKGEAAACDEYVVLHKSQTLPQYWIELEVEIPNLKVLHSHPKFVSELIPHLMKILQNPHIDRDLKLRNILNNQLGILLKVKPDDDLSEDQNKFYQQINTLITIEGIVDQTIRNGLAKPGSPVMSSPLSKSVSSVIAESSTASKPIPPAVTAPSSTPSKNTLSTSSSSTENEAIAKYNLGRQHSNGKGVKQNDEKAFKFYKEAAELGLASAQLELGLCYKEGRGIQPNREEAFKWFLKAADQGDALGQTNVGFCYDRGEGVEKNDKQAFYWYKKAAEQGYVIAQFSVGVCYDGGEGVEKDHKQAFYWYKKAADQGQKKALERLKTSPKKGTKTKTKEQNDIKTAESGTSSGPIPPAVTAPSSIPFSATPSGSSSSTESDAIKKYKLGMQYANEEKC